jgi:hypothetical protein
LPQTQSRDPLGIEYALDFQAGLIEFGVGWRRQRVHGWPLAIAFMSGN